MTLDEQERSDDILLRLLRVLRQWKNGDATDDQAVAQVHNASHELRSLRAALSNTAAGGAS